MASTGARKSENDTVFTVIAAARDRLVLRRVGTVLEDMRVSHRVVASVETERLRTSHAVYCLGYCIARELPELPGPTVLVANGVAIPDWEVEAMSSDKVVFLRLEDVNCTSLLHATISAALGTDIDVIGRDLAALDVFTNLPTRLIQRFLRDPRRMYRRCDLQRTLPSLSRERAQAFVRSLGFERAEHLFTTLRCATWLLLIERGIERRHVERYLGIEDRPTFRRSCVRAGLPKPSARLNVQLVFA